MTFGNKWGKHHFSIVTIMLGKRVLSDLTFPNTNEQDSSSWVVNILLYVNKDI